MEHMYTMIGFVFVGHSIPKSASFFIYTTFFSLAPSNIAEKKNPLPLRNRGMLGSTSTV